MKFQLLSDLHFEHLTLCVDQIKWELHFPIDCDILCLAGDIGDPFTDLYWSFVNYASKHSKYVLIITGNHEAWGKTVQEVDDYLEQKCRDNVIFLQRKQFVYKDYLFLGCTMWSNIPIEYHYEFKQDYPDFKQIKKHNPKIMCKLHEQDKKWLQTTLEENKENKNIIVLTHYAPMFNIPHLYRFQNNISQFMFSSDLRDMFKYVNLWCYGHTHADTESHTYLVEGYNTVFASNQHGYPEAIRYKFKPDFSIVFPILYHCPTIFPKSKMDFLLPQKRVTRSSKKDLN